MVAARSWSGPYKAGFGRLGRHWVERLERRLCKARQGQEMCAIGKPNEWHRTFRRHATAHAIDTLETRHRHGTAVMPDIAC